MAHHTFVVEGYDKATDQKMTKHIEAASEEDAIKQSKLYVKTVERVSGHSGKTETVIKAPKKASKKASKKKADKSPSKLPVMLGMGVACAAVLAIGIAVGFPNGDASQASADEPAPVLQIKVQPIMAGTTTDKVESILGEPDQVKPVKDALGLPATCWVYGSVEIFFGGEGARIVVTHWEGDLEGLIERRMDQ